jgi:hypothetical protein
MEEQIHFKLVWDPHDNALCSLLKTKNSSTTGTKS